MSVSRVAAVCCAAAVWAVLPASADGGTALEAVTASGERVILHPNGRWEYVDPVKAKDARRIADAYPENRVRPPEAQGGLFGLGRTILPGDPDYNRGSLNPKTR